ncbi:Sperm acrosome-associated protein 9 [Holothuria leucospilota]|uniref:Sperm acrosome-associated protein 9 n=1 Tax=Holothuria leucospilota TaxID=206669 RepID=A0A9Q1C6D3_HOLLE|nr:Sperm acrosome-associated protein 9 [Holothuria leucospilota]
MTDLRHAATKLRLKYDTLRQQQMTFVTALDNTRTDAYEKSKPLKTIAEVKELHDRTKNSRDKRAMRQWLDLLASLDSLRKQAESLADTSRDGPMARAMQRWRTLLNPSYDFSGLRAKYPHTEVNHLSCEEARVLFGGCVSLVPFIFDQITKIQSELAKNGEASLDETWPPQRKHSGTRVVQSAKHQRSKTEAQVPVRAKTAMGPRDKAVDTKDLSKRMLRLSLGKLPKGTDESVLYYRRTLNGRADKLHVNGEITLDKAPWRGASYDKINHVDHRRFINLENKYF